MLQPTDLLKADEQATKTKHTVFLFFLMEKHGYNVHVNISIRIQL